MLVKCQSSNERFKLHKADYKLNTE